MICLYDFLRALMAKICHGLHKHQFQLQAKKQMTQRVDEQRGVRSLLYPGRYYFSLTTNSDKYAAHEKRDATNEEAETVVGFGAWSEWQGNRECSSPHQF